MAEIDKVCAIALSVSAQQPEDLDSDSLVCELQRLTTNDVTVGNNPGDYKKICQQSSDLGPPVKSGSSTLAAGYKICTEPAETVKFVEEVKPAVFHVELVEEEKGSELPSEAEALEDLKSFEEDPTETSQDGLTDIIKIVRSDDGAYTWVIVGVQGTRHTAIIPAMAQKVPSESSNFKKHLTARQRSEALAPKLYHIVKQDGKLTCVEAILARDSLNDGDCYILDWTAGGTIYVWCGESATPFVRQKANDEAERMGRERVRKTTVTHDTDEDFWMLLGGEGSLEGDTREDHMP